MTDVNLTFERGFSWHVHQNTHAKGFLFDKDGNFYEGDELARYFSDIHTEEAFLTLLNRSSGLFSVVVQNEEKIFFAVDLLRMFPLFYTGSGPMAFWLGDDPQWAPVPKKFQENNKHEFLATGYVTGPGTLSQELHQLQAGEYGAINKEKLEIHAYDNYLTAKEKFAPDFNKEKEILKSLIFSTFHKYIESFKKHHFVLPLSGGFDSRLIACILKIHGIQNVTCITYGRSGNKEAVTSEKVAKKLGFDWVYIKYDDALIQNYIHDPVFLDYVHYASKYTSQFYMQEYFAVKHLKEEKLIPEDSVFVPGHSGDFVAGSHLSGRIRKKADTSRIVSEIYLRNYRLNRLYNKHRREIQNRLKAYVDNIQALPYSAVENWDWKERQAKFIVNSCSVYNFFGYRHCLPLWDKMLFEYFRDLPFDLKFNKKLYDAAVLELFNEFEVLFDTDLILKHEPAWKSRIKQKIKASLPEKVLRLLWNKGDDPHFYRPITDYMIKEMRNAGYQVNEQVRYPNAIISQWYIYKLTCQWESDRLT